MPKTSQKDQQATLPSLQVMRAFLERVLPGESLSIRIVRDQILEFAATPTAKAVLLRGPIGSGKSTLARLIALLKRVAPLVEDEARQFLDLVPFSGPNQVDLRYLSSWYVELALTGLVESLAETQLFGSVKGGYSDAIDRPGVFEAASTGHMPKGKEVSVGARVTKGIVFLDEIGDLSPQLQAKLLPVLSGGVFYRIGGEGKENAELEFRGVTITASWRTVHDGTLRPDLLSRVAPYVIDIPGVDDRTDDFDMLLDGVEDAITAIFKRQIEELSTTDPAIARAYWRTRIDSLRRLNRAERTVLRRTSWGPRGNLRGLSAAVERILTTGGEADAIVASLPTYQPTKGDHIDDDSLFRRLLSCGATGDRLGSHVKEIERERRGLLRAKLQSDPASLDLLSKTIGIPPHDLRAQLREIDRDRRREER